MKVLVVGMEDVQKETGIGGQDEETKSNYKKRHNIAIGLYIVSLFRYFLIIVYALLHLMSRL